MDQYGNNVDGEIRVPVKPEWRPLGPSDWISRDGIGAPKPPAFVPLDSWTEYGIALADGSIDEDRYQDEGVALMILQNHRSHLKSLGVPEEYWPVLMERNVEIVASSWRIKGV